jgi:hypothetical protein
MQRRLAMRHHLILIATLFGIAGMIAPWFTVMARAQSSEFALVSGWYRDREVKYYDFGTNTKLDGASGVAVAPIYVFVHGMNADGTPDFVEGQQNIVDVRPGDDGYSDLWQVMLVTVPADYLPDSAKSKADIDAAGYAVTETDMFVNCPIVPAGSTLEGGKPLVQGWYKGEEIFYPDFGMNSRAAIPIYVFIHGMNADGTPDFVEGQNNIIDSVPGDPGYSAFWLVTMVTAPDGYVPNSIRSASAVMSSGFARTTTDMVVNCPVTTVAAASGAPVGAPNTGAGPRVADGTPISLLIAVVVAGVAAACGGVLLKVRHRRL